MYDKMLISDSLENIEQSINDILDWTETVESVDDIESCKANKKGFNRR